MSSQRRLLVIVGAIIIIGSMFADQIIAFYIDILWFEVHDVASVLWTILSAQLGLGIFSGGLFFLITYGSLKSIYQKTQHLPVVLTDQMRREVPLLDMLASNLKPLVGLVPLGLALMTGLVVSQEWETIMQYLNKVPFGQSDPIFGKDYSFYLFTLPMLTLVKGLIWEGLVVITLGSGLIYFFKRSIYLSPTGFVFMTEARRTLSLLIAFGFLLLSFEFYMDRFELLIEGGSGVVAGIGYADDNGRLPVLTFLVGLSLVGSIMSFLNIFKPGFRKVLLAGVGLGIVYIGGNFYPAILQKFVVTPNELQKEIPYIEHTIHGTRLAYGLDQVETNELTGSNTLTADAIKENHLTIQNVRLWDQGPLLDTLGQIQEIRTYYQFNSVDNDRYTIGGTYRQTLLAPRELLSTSLPNRTWINEHLTFTHGYGVTLSPVNMITPEGLPVLFIKDIPPQSSVDLTVDRPEIYFGELPNDHVFVNTGTKEFDYPEGEKNVYKNYEGSGGISIGSFLNKVLLAARFKTMKILFSQDIGSDSRVLMYRNIEERVKKIAPFLKLDRDPYLVISEGRLVWLYDAYTVNENFPYSQMIPGFGNYIRNSVKVTIDAYEGSVKFFVSDPNDPIIQTYRHIFPDLFQDLDQMPKDLMKHIRYPSDLFTIQTHIYATYHMNTPQVFYNKEDQWEIPRIDNKRMEPYYTIMKLPQKSREEYILMLPFTPRGKSNLSAWMVARSDGEHYGKLVVYTFPKQKLIYGPSQIVARINQEAEISRQISLWDQRGSQVIQGNLLVIPIEESLIYVRPLYLKADEGKIPELKRVIVGYEDQISMERTLDEALQKIFTGLSIDSNGEGKTADRDRMVSASLKHETATGQVLLQRSDYLRIKDQFKKALEAQKRMNEMLAENQRELEALGQTLDRANPVAPPPPPAEETVSP